MGRSAYAVGADEFDHLSHPSPFGPAAGPAAGGERHGQTPTCPVETEGDEIDPPHACLAVKAPPLRQVAHGAARVRR